MAGMWRRDGRGAGVESTGGLSHSPWERTEAWATAAVLMLMILVPHYGYSWNYHHLHWGQQPSPEHSLSTRLSSQHLTHIS